MSSSFVLILENLCQFIKVLCLSISISTKPAQILTGIIRNLKINLGRVAQTNIVLSDPRTWYIDSFIKMYQHFFVVFIIYNINICCLMRSCFSFILCYLLDSNFLFNFLFFRFFIPCSSLQIIDTVLFFSFFLNFYFYFILLDSNFKFLFFLCFV